MSTTRKYGANSASSRSIAEKTAQENLKRVFPELVRKHLFPAFEQARTAHRVLGILNAMFLMGAARRTITNNLAFQGKDQDSWSADYKAFSDGKWNPKDLFHGVFNAALPLLPKEGPIVLAIDDTGLPHTGEGIENAGWIHNPLVPKWIHPAIQWGVPMLHAALLIQNEKVHRPTGITIAFEPLHREKSKKRRPKSANKAKDPLKAAPPAKGVGAKADGKGVPPTNPDGSSPASGKKRGRPTKEETAQKKAEWLASVTKEEAQKGGNPVAEVKLIATELAVRTIWRVRRWLDEAGLDKRLRDDNYPCASVTTTPGRLG
jgi:hypothetical protein